MRPSSSDKDARTLLARTLAVIFVLSVLMGPGPGLYLINPNANDPDAVRTALGVPIVYAWGILWFVVQAAVIVVAYLKVWSTDDDPDSHVAGEDVT